MSENRRGNSTRMAVRELAQLGLDAEEVASRARISVRHASRLMIESGFKKPGTKHPPVPEPTLVAMRRMVDDGCSFREITRTTGVRFETLVSHFPGRQWTKAQAGSHAQLLRTHRLP